MDQVIIRGTEVNPIAMIFHQAAANERVPLSFALLQSNLNRWFFISTQCLLEHTLFFRSAFRSDEMLDNDRLPIPNVCINTPKIVEVKWRCL